MKYFKSILLLSIASFNFCITQNPVWPLANNWNQINCTFSELHGSQANHIHGALDINCCANYDPIDSNGNPLVVCSTDIMAILDGVILESAAGGTDFMVVAHDFQTNQPTDFLKQSKVS